ncbi:MAG: hypothetical protein E7262_04200 [Lachnospiraceae bacterium]|nr:hypothetical protein [Lachnospiraceae bacterium]
MFFKKFNLFKRKKKQDTTGGYEENTSKINDLGNEELESKISGLSKHDMKAMRKDDYRNKKIREICKNISDAKEEIKVSLEEFSMLKSRLDDVDRIRNSNEERKKKILHIDGKLKQLTEERQKYEKSQDSLEIDTNHYLILEKNETIMVNEIKKLDGYEQEYLDIRSDLHKLEGERGNLNYERQKLLTKKSLLKYYVRLLIIVSIMLFGMFGALLYMDRLNSYVPVLITVAAIALNTIYVINAIRNNVTRLEANRQKENKLIGLFNKVKIKYVNSVKVIEYVYRKFDIKNGKQLKSLWERYLREKDRKFRFDQIMEMTGIQSETLESELDKLELEDKNLWKKNIIVFESEPHLHLVEKKLIEKKDNVKKSIENNKLVVTTGMNDIKTILNSNEAYRDEVIDILRECKLFI